jgi:hypothetical protein
MYDTPGSMALQCQEVMRKQLYLTFSCGVPNSDKLSRSQKKAWENISKGVELQFVQL